MSTHWFDHKQQKHAVIFNFPDYSSKLQRFIHGVFVKDCVYRREMPIWSYGKWWGHWRSRQLGETSRIAEESRNSHRLLPRLFGWLAVQFPIWKQSNLRQTLNKFLVIIQGRRSMEAPDFHSLLIYQYSWKGFLDKPSHRNFLMSGDTSQFRPQFIFTPFRTISHPQRESTPLFPTSEFYAEDCSLSAYIWTDRPDRILITRIRRYANKPLP